MSTVTFDTLKFVERLEAGGFNHEQAKAAAEAFSLATSQELVTKHDLREEAAPIRAELMLLKWMVGFNLALTAGILMLLLRH